MINHDDLPGLLEYIEAQTELGLADAPERWGTFEHVLALVGQDALDAERGGGYDSEAETALRVVADAFRRFQESRTCLDQP